MKKISNLERIRKQLSPARRKKIGTLRQDLMKKKSPTKAKPNRPGYTTVVLPLDSDVVTWLISPIINARLCGVMDAEKEMDRQDIKDARAAIKEAGKKGSISLKALKKKLAREARKWLADKPVGRELI